MEFRQYKVSITGMTPLLVHRDNLEWADTMKLWTKEAKAAKEESIAGDDRSPAWRWIGSIYADNGLVSMPSDNLMTMMREGGAGCLTGGKNGQTFKRQTQSGITVDQLSWPLTINGSAIPWEPIGALVGESDFDIHKRAVESMGFYLFAKRARVGTSKHVRVRPRFDTWACSGTVTVFDSMITAEVLQKILTHAGNYCGLGDWRPSSPTKPGPFGKFIAAIKEV